MIQPKDYVGDLYVPPPMPEFEMKLPEAVQYNFSIPRFTPPEQNPLDSLVGNLSTPEFQKVYQVTPVEERPWLKEGPAYSPYADMEDAYAKADPFTMGDVLYKTYKTATNHLGSSYTVMYGGIKEMLKGNSSGFWSNKYSKELAEASKELEELVPLYRTADQRDNQFALRNLGTTASMVLPALGTVGAAIADVYIGHAIATGIGAFAGPGGIIAANTAALAKDSVALRAAFSGLYGISKALQSTGAAKRIMGLTGAITSSARGKTLTTYGKNLASGLFYANSEAALQGEMNAQSYFEKKKKEYFDEHGYYPTGSELENLTETAKSVGLATYSLNLPLVTMTQISQFGSLFMSKAYPSITAKAGISLNKAGVASANKRYIWDTVKDISSEGFEEFSQSAIDNAVTNFYDPNIAVKGGFVGSLLASHYNHAKTEEGILDFLGGALIGGVVSGIKGTKNLATGTTNRAIAQKVAENFNSSTQSLFENTVRNEYLGQQLAEAFKNEDFELVAKLTRQQAFSLAQSAVYNGTIDARLEQIESMKEMDIKEFNENFQTDLSEQDRNAFVDAIKANVQQASDIVTAVNLGMGTPKFVEDNWFKNIINRVSNTTEQPPVEVRMKLFNDAKAIIAYNAFVFNDMSTALKELMEYIEVPGLVQTNLGQAVSDYKSSLKERIAANLVGDEGLKTFVDSLEGKSNVDAYKAIIEFEGVDKRALDAALKTTMARKVFMDDLSYFQTDEGQRDLMEQVGDYVEYIYGKEKPVTKTPEPEPDAPNPLDNEDPTNPVTPSQVPNPQSPPAAQPATPQPTNNQTRADEAKKTVAKENLKQALADPLTDQQVTDILKSTHTGQEIDAIKQGLYKANGLYYNNTTNPSKINLTQKELNKLPLQRQLALAKDGQVIMILENYFLLTDDLGNKIKVSGIIKKGNNFMITPAKIFGGGVEATVNNAVTNNQIEVHLVSDLTAPEQRQANQRPTKVTHTKKDIDQYMSEQEDKLDPQAYAKDIQFMSNYKSLFEIIC